MNADQRTLAEFIKERFSEGCYLGDAARECLASDDMSDDDEHGLNCAREGWFAAGGE